MNYNCSEFIEEDNPNGFSYPEFPQIKVDSYKIADTIVVRQGDNTVIFSTFQIEQFRDY